MLYFELSCTEPYEHQSSLEIAWGSQKRCCMIICWYRVTFQFFHFDKKCQEQEKKVIMSSVILYFYTINGVLFKSASSEPKSAGEKSS